MKVPLPGVDTLGHRNILVNEHSTVALTLTLADLSIEAYFLKTQFGAYNQLVNHQKSAILIIESFFENMRQNYLVPASKMLIFAGLHSCD